MAVIDTRDTFRDDDYFRIYEQLWNIANGGVAGDATSANQLLQLFQETQTNQNTFSAGYGESVADLTGDVSSTISNYYTGAVFANNPFWNSGQPLSLWAKASYDQLVTVIDYYSDNGIPVGFNPFWYSGKAVSQWLSDIGSLITTSNSKLNTLHNDILTEIVNTNNLVLIKNKTDNLDVLLSTRNVEATQLLIKTDITSINGKDFATQATLAQVKTDVDHLDINLSTRNVEATQLLIKTDTASIVSVLGTVNTILNEIATDTDKLDVNLSTRNVEATQLLIKSDTANLDVSMNTILGTTLPRYISEPENIVGNSNTSMASVGLANVDATVYTVTGGKTLYLKDLNFSVVCTAAGVFYIRDGVGGAIKAVCVSQTGGSINNGFNFGKPKEFTTSVYFDYISGTFANVNIVGGGWER